MDLVKQAIVKGSEDDEIRNGGTEKKRGSGKIACYPHGD